MALYSVGAAINPHARCQTTCWFSYAQAYTPIVTRFDLAGGPGENLTIAGSLRAKTASGFEVRVEGVLAELKHEPDDILFSHRHHTGTLRTLVPNVAAGRYNVSVNAQTDLISWGAGFADHKNAVWQAEGGKGDTSLARSGYG